ncbi:SGNH/GDSL hydrolase family protein [Nanoarchaeota archaeon]
MAKSNKSPIKFLKENNPMKKRQGVVHKFSGSKNALAMRKVVSVLIIWAIIFIAGFFGAELYARHTQGYELNSFSLRKSFFYEPDKLKVYNKAFYEQRKDYFADWPISLVVFEHDKPTPRYLFKPNLNMTTIKGKLVPAKAGDEINWSSNSWGLRGAEFSIKKPRDTIRIVCLGASTTEGSQSDNETYPFFLEQELGKVYSEGNIEVINAGHHAMGVDDLLEILKLKVLPLQPDVVIYYQAANDMQVNDFLSGIDCKVGWPKGECWLHNSSAAYRWIIDHSAAFVYFSELFGDKSIPEQMPHTFDISPPKPSAEHYEESLRMIVNETLNNGSKIILSSFITIAHEGFEIQYKENPSIFNDLYKKWYPITSSEFEQIFTYFNKKSAEVAYEFDVPYADVAAKFPKELRYFSYDLIHFTPEGNQLLAKLFAEQLKKEVLPEIIKSQKEGLVNS